MDRTQYHASWILLYRTSCAPSDFSTVSGHVPSCLEHSVAVHDLCVAYSSTFGRRMPYLAMYSSFVAA